MKTIEDEMPVELKLELLVDAELPEEERRELLLALDREPGRWRELSMRFLERQVEKRVAREWVGGEAKEETPANYPFRAVSAPARRYLRPIAAGLLVAAASAAATMYAVRQPARMVDPMVTQTAGPMATDIPGEALNYSQPVHVNVPVENVRNGNQPFFPEDAQVGDDVSSRRSVVIQADASGNPVMIPVSPLRVKFY